MRTFITILLLLFWGTNMFAQRNQGKTYALIIGISAFDDTRIETLKYAHRDAEIFKDYLMSEAGGSLQDTSINILTNQNATSSAIHEGFVDLIDRVKKNDKVIIYFSGHGDVESRLFSPKGFFLAYDTPYNNYRTNGVRIEDFNDYATTLALTNEAKVIIYIDACHAGELAGTGNQGPVLAAREARKTIKNVVKIMSCQPEEESLEMEALDGGRGLFSYYLVKGLMGEADLMNPDLKVSKDELIRYVSDNVSRTAEEEFDGHSQTPDIEGKPKFEMAFVNEDLFAKFKNESIKAFSKVPLVAQANHPANNDHEETLIAEADPLQPDNVDSDDINSVEFDEVIQVNEADTDTPDEEAVLAINIKGVSTKKIYPPFDRAIQQKDLLAPEGTSAYDIYQNMLKSSPNDSRLRAMKSQLVISLQDEAQKGINAYLRTDQKELDRRVYIKAAEQYKTYPEYLKKAAELVGPKYKTYNGIKAKQKYFEGINLRLEVTKTASNKADLDKGLKKAMEIQQKALGWDDEAAYIHNEIGVLHLKMGNYEAAKAPFDIAIKYAPTWALPYSNLASLYLQLNELQTAEEYGLKAIALNPDYMNGYINMGIINELSSNMLMAEHYYRKAIYANWNHYSGFQNLAFTYTLFGDYELADHLFKEADFRKEGLFPTIESIGIAMAFVPSAEVMSLEVFTEEYLLELIRKDPNDYIAWNNLGDLYVGESRNEEAENCYLRVVEINPDHYYTYISLGDLYQSWNRTDDAIATYYRPIELSGSFNDAAATCAYKIWDLYELLERNQESENLITEYVHSTDADKSLLYDYFTRMIQRYADNPEYWYKRGLLLYKEKQDGYLWHSSMPEEQPISNIKWEGSDIEKTADIPRIEKWNYYWGMQAIDDFEQVFELNDNHVSKADIHLKLGELYGIWAELYKEEIFTEDRMYVQGGSSQKEQYQYYLLFFDKYEQAIENTLATKNLKPEQLGPVYQLIDQYTATFEHHKALPLLQQLHINKELDFKRRTHLVQSYIYSGELDKAKGLLDFSLNKNIGASKEDLVLNSLYHRLVKADELSISRAISNLKLALEFDPENNGLQYRMASLNVLNGSNVEALKWFKKAFKNGFDYKKVLAYDPDLTGIRDDRKYNKLLHKYKLN